MQRSWPLLVDARIAPNDICCCCLVVKPCPTLRDPMDQSMPGPPVFHCLLEMGQIHVGSFDDTVQTSHPLSSPSPLAFTFSQHQGLSQGVFSSHEMAKVLEPQFRICPSSEHSGLISFRMDKFVLLAVQGILKSLLQHHNSKALILWRSAFFAFHSPGNY